MSMVDGSGRPAALASIFSDFTFTPLSTLILPLAVRNSLVGAPGSSFCNFSNICLVSIQSLRQIPRLI